MEFLASPLNLMAVVIAWVPLIVVLFLYWGSPLRLAVGIAVTLSFAIVFIIVAKWQSSEERSIDIVTFFQGEQRSYLKSGEDDDARLSYGKALLNFSQQENRFGEASVLRSLGHVERTRGRYDQAREAYRLSVLLFREVGIRIGEASALRNLGDLEEVVNNNMKARRTYGEALKIIREIGDRPGEASVLRSLGHLEKKLDHEDEARESYRESLKLFRQAGDPLGEANVLRGLGDLETNANPEKAKEFYYEAAKLYGKIGLRKEEESALEKARALPIPSALR